jgi:hypothetical protein
MRLLLRAVAVLCVCISVTSQVRSQISSAGRDFYFCYVPNTFTCTADLPYRSAFMLVSSFYDCNVTISYFDHVTGKEVQNASKHVQAKQKLQVPVDLSFVQNNDANGQRLNPNGEVAEYTAIHVHADHPVTVHYYSTGPVFGSMYLSLPTAALGKRYVIATLPGNPATGAAQNWHCPGQGLDPASSMFAVIGVADSTNITISPTFETLGGKSQPFTTSIKRGQVYWVMSHKVETDDLSGSLVVADKPVAIIAAEEAAFNGQHPFGTDNRNLIAQQMVPVEFWRTHDYISMPIMDVPGLAPENLSYGDLFRVFADQTRVQATFFDALGSSLSQNVDRTSPWSIQNVSGGSRAGSINGEPMMVVQYDYRAQGSQEPMTAPTMMNVVPLQNFATSYMLAVPDDPFQVHKKRYINVIARQDQISKIKIWFNGKNPKSITSLTAAGRTAQIPGHPELTGRRYEVNPGVYYATADSVFGLYTYGMLGLDPDNDLGDNDGDDYYFEYASPAGENFATDGALKPNISVANTSCHGWDVRVSDRNTIDRGVAQVEILDDPLGVFKRKAADSGYVSANCMFDPPNFTVLPGDTAVNVKVIVKDQLQNADAWVWAVNGAGGDTLIHLHYNAPQLSFEPSGPIKFEHSAIGVDSCVRFVFKNIGGAGGGSIHITGYRFLVGSQGFKVTSGLTSLPQTLSPGDSAIFSVCFTATKAAQLSIDTLVVETDCPQPMVALLGTTSIPIINTEDYDFGSVLVGQRKCHNIRVWNTGDAPMTLTKEWLLENISDFTFTDTARLPIQVGPGMTVTLSICFTPHAEGQITTTMHWSSDIPEPYTHVKKDFSELYGVGLKPNLLWDRAIQYFKFHGDTAQSSRIYLANYGTASVLVDSVSIIGPEADEFVITAAAEGVPTNLPFDLHPADSVWYDITFKPDISKGFRLRNDTLIAWDKERTNPQVILNADFASGVHNSGMDNNPTVRIITDPAGHSASIYITESHSTNAKLLVFDALGRTIRELRVTGEQMTLDVSAFVSGAYYVRVSNGKEVQTARFEVFH